MENKEFFNWILENDCDEKESFQRGYKCGVSVYWDEKEGEKNPFEEKSLDWWLFEEGKGQAGQDL